MRITINNDTIAERELTFTVFSGIIDGVIKYPGGREHILPAIIKPGRNYLFTISQSF